MVHALVDDETARGGAALATGAHGAEDGGGDGHVEVGTGGDDDGVVAAQLQQAFAHAGGHGLADGFAHAGAAGGADQGNAVVGGHGFTDLGVADDQAEDAFRDVVGAQHGRNDALAGDGAEGRLLAGLPHDGVTADGGQHGIPAPDGDGEVERADDADHA